MVRIFKQKLETLSLLRAFLRMEFKKNISLGSIKFIKSSKGGFFSISPVLYDFKKNDQNDYISDWTRLRKVAKINDKRRLVIDDKLIFHLINKDNPHVMPILAQTKNRKLFKVINNKYKEINIEIEFKEFVGQYRNGLIIKPITGGGGGHISKVFNVDGNLIFKGECENIDQFRKKVIQGNREFLFTEIINQDGICSEIYPETLNTVRILTMVEPVNGKPFIAAAVQRFGTSKSVVVDNWSAGGLSVFVDKQTGELGIGASYPKKDDIQVKWYKSHPDTHKTFYGQKIPNWEVIKTAILEMAEAYHFLPYIGWDVVPMEKGFYILEGNANSDVNLLQIHGGLLADNRNKSFYKFYKVI